MSCGSPRLASAFNIPYRNEDICCAKPDILPFYKCPGTNSNVYALSGGLMNIAFYFFDIASAIKIQSTIAALVCVYSAFVQTSIQYIIAWVLCGVIKNN